MPIDPDDLPALTSFFSAERLAALTELTGHAAAAIELHQETLRLGASLLNVIATLEIALRNSVTDNLRHHFGVPNWLQNPPAEFQWRSQERGKIATAVDNAKRAEYAKLTHSEKAALDILAYPGGRPASTSHMTRVKARRQHITVTDGKIIAELTLYFWKRLYSPDYEQSLWRPTLKRTFPDKNLSRADVAIQLETLYQSRNRLAHHEPVLHQRFHETMTAIEFISQRLLARRASAKSPLASLLADDIAEIRTRESNLSARLDAYRR